MYNIILIDDEPYVLEQFSELFDWNDMGYNLIGTFSDASEALDCIRKNKVDVIVSDIKMPGMSGLELAKFCYEYYPDTKIILLTAFRQFEYAQEAIKYNVVDYIVKPVSYDSIKQSLMRINAKTHASAVSDDYLEENTYKNDVVFAAITYVNANLENDISLVSVAQHVNMNPSYFSHYFKKHVNMNFVDFLTNLRIERAKQILRCDDMSILDICYVVGYKNQTHFYNVFKTLTGVTPAQYRAKYRSNSSAEK